MAELVKNYSNGSAIKIVYSYTQNVSKNQSTITMTLYVKRDAYGPSWNTKCDAYIQLDGSKVMTYDGSFNIGTSWVKIGSTVSKTVTHNADGTKTISLKGFFDSLGLTSKLDDLTVSGNVTLKTIPRASSISSISGSTIGSPVTVNISREVSSFTHKVYYSFGETKDYLLGSSVGTSLTFTPSMNDCKYIPNSTKGTAAIRVDTYNGSTKIGSTSKNFTLNVPASVVPTFSKIEFTPAASDVPADWGIYVRTKSKVTAKITGAAGTYGSTIKSYSISGGGYSGTGSSLTTGYLNTAGTVTFTAKITDSRGRTATKTASITVTDYAPPVLSSVAGFRCDSAGTEQDDGNYISLTANFSGSVLDGKNPVTGEYRYKAEGGDWSGFSPLVSGEPAVFAATGDATFTVQVQVSDTFSNFTQNIVVNSIRFIMDFKAGGTGVSFGKAAEYDDILESAWRLILHQTGADQIILQKKSGEADNAVRFTDPLSELQDDWKINQYASEQGVSNSLRFMTNSGSDSPDDYTSAMILYAGKTAEFFGTVKAKSDVVTPKIGMNNKTYLAFYDANYMEFVTTLGSNKKKFEILCEQSGEKRLIFRPKVNSVGWLGTAGYRWNTGYFTNTITQSDLKDKENIREISGAKGFIMALQPIAYTLKDGDGGRIHMGFGAQQVAQAAAEHGMGDLSLYQASRIEKDGREAYYSPETPDEDLRWGLNYHEFLAPLIALVQEQETRIQQLEEQLDKIQKG